MAKVETIKKSIQFSNVDVGNDPTSRVRQRVLINADPLDDANYQIFSIKLLDNDLKQDTRVLSGFLGCFSLSPMQPGIFNNNNGNVNNIVGVSKIYLVKENILNDVISASAPTFPFGLSQQQDDLYFDPENVILIQAHTWSYNDNSTPDSEVTAVHSNGSSIIINGKIKRKLEKGDNLYLLVATKTYAYSNSTFVPEYSINNLYGYFNYTAFLKC